MLVNVYLLQWILQDRSGATIPNFSSIGFIVRGGNSVTAWSLVSVLQTRKITTLWRLYLHICYLTDTGMSVKEITLYRDPIIWTMDTLIPVKHIYIEARRYTPNFNRPQCVKKNIMRFVHKIVYPVDQNTVILWVSNLRMLEKDSYSWWKKLYFYFNLFIGKLVWNNRRVNSISSSLYDDKPFTEKILILEEKREWLGARFNIYFLLKSIDID